MDKNDIALKQFKSFIYNEEINRIKTKTRDEIPSFYTKSILGMTLLKENLEMFSEKIIKLITESEEEKFNFNKIYHENNIEFSRKFDLWNQSTISSIYVNKDWVINLKIPTEETIDFMSGRLNINKDKKNFTIEGSKGSIIYNENLNLFIFQNKDRDNENKLDSEYRNHNNLTKYPEKKELLEVYNLSNVEEDYDILYLEDYAEYLLKKYMLSIIFPIEIAQKNIESNFKASNILENINQMQKIFKTCIDNKIDTKILESEIFSSNLIGKKITENLINELKEAVDITFLANDIDLNTKEKNNIKEQFKI